MQGEILWSAAWRWQLLRQSAKTTKFHQICLLFEVKNNVQIDCKMQNETNLLLYQLTKKATPERR